MSITASFREREREGERAEVGHVSVALLLFSMYTFGNSRENEGAIVANRFLYGQCRLGGSEGGREGGREGGMEDVNSRDWKSLCSPQIHVRLVLCPHEYARAV